MLEEDLFFWIYFLVCLFSSWAALLRIKQSVCLVIGFPDLKNIGDDEKIYLVILAGDDDGSDIGEAFLGGDQALPAT